MADFLGHRWPWRGAGGPPGPNQASPCPLDGAPALVLLIGLMIFKPFW